jgi:DNA-binding NarL/FixJ family response regulator
MDGLDAIKSIRAIRAETKFIVITIHDEPDYVLRAFQAGATGYLLKDSTLQKLQDTVRRVLQGELHLDSALARKAFASVGGAKAATAESLVESLTHRELDVLRLIAEGRTNPEIAAIFGTSRGTVKTHVQRIIAKLGVIDRTQAAVKGVQLGLVTPNPSPPERPDSV